MWARTVEIMLGFWLMASPFIFRAETLANDLLCGLLVIVFGLLAYWNRTEWAHFLTLGVSIWLIGFGYWAGHPAPPEAQNQIVVGLLLGMFAIIPNRTNELPESWQKFYAKQR